MTTRKIHKTFSSQTQTPDLSLSIVSEHSLSSPLCHDQSLFSRNKFHTFLPSVENDFAGFKCSNAFSNITSALSFLLISNASLAVYAKLITRSGAPSQGNEGRPRLFLFSIHHIRNRRKTHTLTFSASVHCVTCTVSQLFTMFCRPIKATCHGRPLFHFDYLLSHLLYLYTLLSSYMFPSFFNRTRVHFCNSRMIVFSDA